MARRNWTWDETLMAFALYLILPARECDDAGIDVINLAKAINRTPSSVNLKIWNIAAHDEHRLSTGRKGLEHGSKLDSLVWDEFAARGDALLDEALELLVAAVQNSDQKSTDLVYAMTDLPPEGKEREVIATQRVNQQYFRNTLLENYLSTCCLTGMNIEPLLVASHIKPWNKSNPKTERLAPSNGLLLNAFHDKAFDRGLITVDTSYKVVVSKRVRRNSVNSEWLLRYEGQKIILPKINPPSKEFLEYHNDLVFLH